MSPKWQRPTGTEKESGARTYVSGKEYPEQMRTKTDKAALDEKPFHLSEFKKPYEADSYEEMEHFFSWPQGHRPGFDSPMEESGKTTYEYKDPLEWDPTLDVKAIEAYDSDTVGVIQNEGKCKWKLDESGLTSGAVSMGPTGKNDVNCVLSPSIDADGSFIVRATDSRKKNKWIWRSIDVTPKVPEMVLEFHITVIDGVGVDIYKYVPVSEMGVIASPLDGYDHVYNRIAGSIPSTPDYLRWHVPSSYDYGPIKQLTETSWATQYELRRADDSVIRATSEAIVSQSGSLSGSYYPEWSQTYPGSLLWQIQNGPNFLVYLSYIASFNRTGWTDTDTWESSPTLVETATINFGTGIGVIDFSDVLSTVIDGEEGWESQWPYPTGPRTRTTGTYWFNGARFDGLGANNNYVVVGLVHSSQVMATPGMTVPYYPSALRPVRAKGIAGGVAFDSTLQISSEDKIAYELNLVSGVAY